MLILKDEQKKKVGKQQADQTSGRRKIVLRLSIHFGTRSIRYNQCEDTRKKSIEFNVSELRIWIEHVIQSLIIFLGHDQLWQDNAF